MQNSISAFVDKCGNNSIDSVSQGTHFIVATVICTNENIDQLKNQIETIRRDHNFQTGELK